jgi:hypothetical protein
MVRIIREDPDDLPEDLAPQQGPEQEPRGGGPPPWLLAGLGVLAVVGALAGAVFFTAGSETPDEQAAVVTPRPTATATPIAQGLLKQAEAQFLPRMSQPLADLVRAQGWYQELTPEKLALIDWLLKTEIAARSQGEPKAAAELFQFVTEQDWYLDGFDEFEATGITGVLRAYERSFAKALLPVGATISSTIRHKLFDIAVLPESGPVVVIAASKDPAQGRKLLSLVMDNFANVEAMVGKYPYPFLYIEVNSELTETLGLAGGSADEFIIIAPDEVKAWVVVHEITHSTVYGLFPTWFEEGLAYVVNEHLTGDLGSFVRSVARTAPARAAWLDVWNYRVYMSHLDIYEHAGGLLLLNAIFEIEGYDAFSATVKALRTRTYNDNELLVRILELAPEDKKNEVRKLYCDRVVGTTRNYCVSGQ